MIKKYLYKGETYTSADAVRSAIEHNENKRFGPNTDTADFWTRLGVVYTEEPEPEPTEEEIKAEALAKAKRVRESAVAQIKVTVDGMEFDGDEVAQGRMSRTIAVAVAQGADLETTTRTWVLADNTVATVTVRQLAQALELAGNAQTTLWTVPYEDGNE